MTLRTPEAEARYRRFLKKDKLHRLEQLPSKKEFEYFKIVTAEFPHDKIAYLHDLLVPKRVVDHWTKLNAKEWQEFKEIDKYLSENYDCIKLNYPSYITINYIVHWHLYGLK